MTKILLVEDDQSLGKALYAQLSKENFSVTHAKTLEEANKAVPPWPDIILLDWMLPDGQGIDFLHSVRRQKQNLPIIMLTARAELVDKVVGLEGGANDYMTKPFEMRELIARIRVQLRSKPQEEAKIEPVSQVSQGAGISMHHETREVRYQNNLITLTKMEYDLLKLFLDNQNKVLSRDEILNKVWGFESYPTTRTVDTHVLQLRQKFSDALFETVRGIGYRFKEKT